MLFYMLIRSLIDNNGDLDYVISFRPINSQCLMQVIYFNPQQLSETCFPYLIFTAVLPSLENHMIVTFKKEKYFLTRSCFLGSRDF